MDIRLENHFFDKHFDSHKSNQNIENNDLSRKSSIDSYIQNLIEHINKSANYFTTSSCSGRFIAYSLVSQLLMLMFNYIELATNDGLMENEIFF